MDELTYRLRDLDGVAEHAGRLPFPDELRRRGDRKRRRQRTRLAAATFVVVAVLAGGVTAWLGDGLTQADGATTVPIPPLSTSLGPVPSATTPSGEAPPSPPPTSTGTSGAVPEKTDPLRRDRNESFWVWAQPAADGNRMLSANPETGRLDLSRSTRTADPDGGTNDRGQMRFMPVVEEGESLWMISGAPDGEAGTQCATRSGVSFRLKNCDVSDVEQLFLVERHGKAYTITPRALLGGEAPPTYLQATGRRLTLTAGLDRSSSFILEKVPD